MGYKLIISNTVRVPIKLTLNDAGKEKEFSFTLVCDRLDADEIQQRQQSGEALISDLVRGVTRGWEGQTLVVDEEGKPAEFDIAAFDVLLSVKNLSAVLYAAYLKECGAKAKN